MDKILTLENGSLISLSNWLGRQAIPGMKSRERTRFLAAIRENLLEVDKFRLELVKEHADVDEKGEFVMNEDPMGRKNFELSDENRKLVEDGFDKKLSETYSLAITPEIEKSYEFVKNLVVNTPTEFSGKEAEEFDKWCSAFESDSKKVSEKDTAEKGE